MLNCLAVGLGGFIGAISRYLMGFLPLGTAGGFPVVTLLVNALGSLAIGLIVGWADRSVSFNPQLLLFLKVGFCGGFTTFSTFSLESWALISGGKLFLAASYMILSVLLCLGMVWLGQILVK